MKQLAEYEALQLYNDFLDEIYPDCKIGGYEYSTSKALYEVDPTAYRCGFNDWCDSEGIEVVQSNEKNHYVLMIDGTWRKIKPEEVQGYLDYGCRVKYE